MAIPQLGTLTRIANLKEVWEHEATSFTPWLALEENIELIADAVGLEELIVEAQEKSVGPFRADILCKDTLHDRYVLIENQLERTDHTHLGQILTYAAGLGACTIVWIAKTFTEEHRAALDWLNEITDERFHFFGLEIELWRIGASSIAPKFNVISKPNDWTRTVQTAAKELEAANLTPRDLLLKEFWTQLRAELELHKCRVRTQRPLPQSWTNAALGRAGVFLVAVATVQRRTMRVQVLLNGPNRLTFFHQLLRMRVEIEAEVGAPLLWNENPDKQESHIRLTRDGVDLSVKENWPELVTWMREKLERLHATFSRRVRDLDVTGGIEPVG